MRELLVIVLLSLLLVPVVAFTSGALRIALGLAFVLFFPGYMLIAALFPRKGSLDGIERLALSFGLSIAVVPLIGLVLNYTSWGIRLEPIVCSLLIFILAMAGVALYRRQRLLPQERFEVNFKGNLSCLLPAWRGQGPWDRMLTVLLVMAVAGAAGTLVYAIQTPKVGERFTEFYILGAQGKEDFYPRELSLGESGQVLLGVVNREHERTSYKVEIWIDGEKAQELGPITLDHQEKWEQEAAFAPPRAGPGQKVEFRLYRGEGGDAYRTLHLWVNVEEKQK